MKDTWSSIGKVAISLAVVASVWFVLEIGLGETYTAITDPTGASAATQTAFGGSIDFVERIATFAMGMVVLGPLGVGALKASRTNPEVVNTAIKFALPIAGLICVVTMTDTLTEFIQGDRVWANFNDAQNAWALAMCSAAVAGIASFIRNR